LNQRNTQPRSSSMKHYQDNLDLIPLRTCAEALEKNARLRRVRVSVFRNFRKRISSQEAAKYANLEAHYFSTYFRIRVGVTFSHWQQMERVRVAKTLLRAGNLNISQIAYDVGYPDLTSFERLFRRHCNISPSQYRKFLENAD